MKKNFLMNSIGLAVLILVASSLSGCWLVAAGAGGEAGYVAAQDNRTAGETIDDQMIVSSVKAKLVADPDTSGFSINVDSFKGNVTLRGYTNKQYEIDRAVELARSVSGVKSVTSKMVLEVG